MKDDMTAGVWSFSVTVIDGKPAVRLSPTDHSNLALQLEGDTLDWFLGIFEEADGNEAILERACDEAWHKQRRQAPS